MQAQAGRPKSVEHLRHVGQRHVRSPCAPVRTQLRMPAKLCQTLTAITLRLLMHIELSSRLGIGLVAACSPSSAYAEASTASRLGGDATRHIRHWSPPHEEITASEGGAHLQGGAHLRGVVGLRDEHLGDHLQQPSIVRHLARKCSRLVSASVALVGHRAPGSRPEARHLGTQTMRRTALLSDAGQALGSPD